MVDYHINEDATEACLVELSNGQTQPLRQFATLITACLNKKGENVEEIHRQYRQLLIFYIIHQAIIISFCFAFTLTIFYIWCRWLFRKYDFQRIYKRYLDDVELPRQKVRKEFLAKRVGELLREKLEEEGVLDLEIDNGLEE